MPRRIGRAARSCIGDRLAFALVRKKRTSSGLSTGFPGRPAFLEQRFRLSSYSSMTMWTGSCSSKNFENVAMRGGRAW